MTKLEPAGVPGGGGPTGRGGRHISPGEWIADYFSPVVSVLSSADAEAVCAKNNLTLCELLQPFSKLSADVTLKDPEGANHAVAALGVSFQDFRKDPCRMVNQKLMADLLAENCDEPMVSREFASGVSLSAPGFTPWFDTWVKLYINSVPTVDHEFVRHHLGCVYAVSASSDNPITALRNLSEQHYRHQHEKPTSYPQYATTHALKYYILVQDAYDTEDSKAQEVFTQMQNAFGASSCHLLQLNSVSSSNAAAAPSSSSSSVAGFWLAQTHRFCNVEARRQGIGATVITTSVTAAAAAANETNSERNNSKPSSSENSVPPPKDAMAHPLAAAPSNPLMDGGGVNNDGGRTPTPPLPAGEAFKLQPVTSTNIATRLTSSDVDRIRILVREFVIKCLIPHVERQLRTLHEVVTNRKSRSLFSGAKRWFGGSQNKGGAGGAAGAAGVSSVIYGKEAPELQMRKLADLYFMFKMYKSAYGFYHTAKKDFQSDEAWNYYAGAAEMSALAQYMQNDPSKKYPAHYIEDAITKYHAVCQLPEFAIRATLFDTMCLKGLGMFQEAAVSYIRMTNESKDLRSSLLLEQASYCFLLSNPPLLRKYAFHIILAGFRFSKSGQKRHASRAYQQGFQIYRGLGWGLSEDHILYTLGHQSLLLKDHANACTLFNELLERTKPGSAATTSPLQQMCHLREFFIVHHLREKESGVGNNVITIPRFRSQECVLDLSGTANRDYDALKSLHQKESWKNLEKVMMENVRGSEVMFLSKSCQEVFTPVSSNALMPTVTVGEAVRLLMPVSNDFQATLLLKKAKLLWKFLPDEQSDHVTNEGKDVDQEEASKFVKTEPLSLVTLEKSTTVNIALQLTPLQPGDLFLVGVEYGMKAQFPQTESTDYTIHGKQRLATAGPRLTSSKEHKTSVVYGADNRLKVRVRSGRPRLSFALEELPAEVRQGELRRAQLVLSNVSPAVAVSRAFLFCHTPGFISFGRAEGREGRRALFQHPVIDEDCLATSSDSGQEFRTRLDMLPVPLESELKPGQTLKLPLWIRGPIGVGTNTVRFHVYYQNAAAADDYRAVSREITMKTVPSITASATWNDVSVFDDNLLRSRNVTVHLSNISKADSAPIEVGQISLVSHSNRLVQLESSSGAALAVRRADSLAVSLKAQRATGSEEEDGGGGSSGRVHFSSVSCSGEGGGGGHDVQLPPHLDFLKPGFAFDNSLAGRKKPPRLKEDLIVVFWKSVKSATSSTLGVLVTPLRRPAAAAQVTSDAVDGGRRAPNRAALPCAAGVSLVGAKSPIEHDFRASPQLIVPCAVTVTNTGTAAARLSLKTEDGVPTGGEGCSSVALGSVNLRGVAMRAGEKKSFPLRLVVTSPGVVRYRSLGLRMDREGDSDAADAEYVPLEISFVVEQTQKAR